MSEPLNFDAVMHLPEQACPYCGHKLTSHSGPGQPSRGDFSVCIRCANLLVFGDGARLRKLTPSDQATIDDDPELANQLRRVQEGIREVKARLN
jgi:hypothetical protein